MIIGFFELSEAVKLEIEKNKEKEETHDSILHKCSKKRVRIVFNNGETLTDKSLTLKFLF
jgi:hypothetical protein